MCSDRLKNKRPALLHGGERGGTGNFFKQLELLRLAFSQHGRFFIEIIRDGFEPRIPLVNDDAKKHAFAFHLRMNLANDEAVFVDIPVKPSDEEPVPGFLSAIARVAQIKHDFEVRAEKFFDDGKDGGFHFGVVRAARFLYLADDKLIGIASAQHDVFLAEAHDVMDAQIRLKHEIAP